MVELSITAPGKVILYGEHAVVFGKTALAVSIDLRTKLHLKIFLEAGRVAGFTAAPVLGPVPRKARTMHTRDIVIHTKFCAGLGSSAALSVCSAGGLYLHSKQRGRPQLAETITDITATPRDLNQLDLTGEEKKKISEWAFMFEKIMHGTPSGIDNSVSTFGGVLAYRSGKMSPVSDLSGLQVLLVNTHVPRNTRELVSAVRNKYSQLPKVIGPMLDAIERVSQTAISTLQTSAGKGFTVDCIEEFKTLEHLIDINHGILTGLGVSHPALSKVVEISATHNIHAKLTGAGGGGFALGLIHPHIHRSQVDRARVDLQGYGYTCYEIDIGGTGIQAWTST